MKNRKTENAIFGKKTASRRKKSRPRRSGLKVLLLSCWEICNEAESVLLDCECIVVSNTVTNVAAVCVNPALS